MTGEMMNFRTYAKKARDADILPEMPVFAAERLMEMETMNEFTISIEVVAGKEHRVVVCDHARKSVTRLDAFSKKHAHEIALDLIDLLPKLHRAATVAFDAFVLPAQA